jgi:hypothetical protein
VSGGARLDGGVRVDPHPRLRRRTVALRFGEDRSREVGVPFNLKLFVVALLYGSSLAAAVSNSIVLALRLLDEASPGGALPIALMGWGIVLYVHRQMGWPPFRPSRRS